MYCYNRLLFYFDFYDDFIFPHSLSYNNTSAILNRRHFCLAMVDGCIHKSIRCHLKRFKTAEKKASNESLHRKCTLSAVIRFCECSFVTIRYFSSVQYIFLCLSHIFPLIRYVFIEPQKSGLTEYFEQKSAQWAVKWKNFHISLKLSFFSILRRLLSSSRSPQKSKKTFWRYKLQYGIRIAVFFCFVLARCDFEFFAKL